jgi:hypothetical protein
MPKKILITLLFTIIFISKNVYANWYVGGQYTFTMIDLNLTSDVTFTPSAIMLKGGYDLQEFLALEFRVGTGITKGKREILGAQRTLKVNSAYGGYLKLQTGNKKINPYLMVGFTKAELKTSNTVTTAKDDDDGASYGFGIEGPLSDSTYFNLEFMRYFDEDSVTIDAISFGLITRY